MGGETVGREGDWECNGCSNRNYAFRSFCNRCKHPRLLVDTQTPPHSKWLPRLGDWICTGCTNNNYASREKCKKCGQSKETAAMPALAIREDSLPTHSSYIARPPGGTEQYPNNGFSGGRNIQYALPSSSWPLGGSDHYASLPANGYALHPASQRPSGRSNISGVVYASQPSQPASIPTGWRTGDWICPCGFHNYSSRAQCKKCSGSMPSTVHSSFVSTGTTALGMKRMASEELVLDLDNKRPNAGHQPYLAVEAAGVPHVSNLPSSIYPNFTTGVPAVPHVSLSNLQRSHVPPVPQVNFQAQHIPAVPVIFGKGAKQWRDGDWMCTNCNNHNYASRSTCNRCKVEREVLPLPVTVA